MGKVVHLGTEMISHFGIMDSTGENIEREEKQSLRLGKLDPDLFGKALAYLAEHKIKLQAAAHAEAAQKSIEDVPKSPETALTSDR